MPWFELSIARKYLVPRTRQLSVSIISLISIGVIALVVWLVVVFFSVTNGLEKFWIKKLITLTGPIRITPTEAYYRSYYYLVDSISEASGYQTRSIAEKLQAEKADPYDPYYDEEPPPHWPAPERNERGELKDLVKEAYAAVQAIPGASAAPFETTFGNIRLRLVRTKVEQGAELAEQTFLAQAAMFGSLEEENPQLRSSLLPLSPADIRNLLLLAPASAANIQADKPDALTMLDQKAARERLRQVCSNLTMHAVTTNPEGWILPRHLLKSAGWVEAAAVLRRGKPVKLIVASTAAQTRRLIRKQQEQGFPVKPARVFLGKEPLKIQLAGQKEQTVPFPLPVVVAPSQKLSASLAASCLDQARNANDLRFAINTELQGLTLQGTVSLNHLTLSDFTLKESFIEEPALTPLWLYHLAQTKPRAILPLDPLVGEGVLLPKQFQDAGVLLADRGYISYFTPTPSSVQEQRVAVYVAGFYDPGMIPVGGKLVFVNPKITSLITSAHAGGTPPHGTGLRVRFNDYSKAEEIKGALNKSLRMRGIDPYWKVETFREYEYASDILRQQKSDKNLFMVIAAVILIVACSNIISMLIILVNDKKLEIGILRSMGASSQSIAAIFGLCGFVMGLVGSTLGIAAAFLTLRNLDTLIALVSRLQGHELFHPTFYGSSLPNELSLEALLFVLGLTASFSLLAGIVPALKACWLRPSAILRAE